MALTPKANRLLLIATTGTIAILLVLILRPVPPGQPEPESNAALSPLPPLSMVPWVCRPQSVEDQTRRLSLDEAASSAALSLAKEDKYATGLIGIAATPAQADAWLEHLRAQPNAVAIFEAIYYASDTTTAGRLQALRGLFHTDRPKFNSIASRLRNNGLRVYVQHGCIVESVTVQDVVEEIERGRFARYSRRIPNPLLTRAFALLGHATLDTGFVGDKDIFLSNIDNSKI